MFTDQKADTIKYLQNFVDKLCISEPTYAQNRCVPDNQLTFG